ncbi:interferon-induced, double-stranded RNA-activated protein kinase-like [Papaver somniferum]|uniref:interferon-induced, double-stranded RNA-activated protein kinase-like n=1 Tax=Papaver somniferum TaxID=3469 RepID=UPI000E6F7ED4|nr:interferon-induced, double-stranded RNA-activated protein kinase-like [Papaver somniferum]
MHQQQVYHRDLASSNIFLSESSKIKIGDFGIAKIGDVDLHSTRLGQGLYTAAKVDIYSLGILLLELLSECTFTWDRFDKIKEFVDHGIIPEVVDQRYRELIVLLTSTDPTKRPWAAEIQEIFNKMEGGACCAPQEQWASDVLYIAAKVRVRESATQMAAIFPAGFEVDAPGVSYDFLFLDLEEVAAGLSKLVRVAPST